ARLRLDQGFKSEAALLFRDYLEQVRPAENPELLEKNCRQMFDLLLEETPIGAVLERLEAAKCFAAAFEIVRTLAQRAADAGDSGAAEGYSEKMRSRRVLVERSGGRDVVAESAKVPSVPAETRMSYDPRAIDLSRPTDDVLIGEAAAERSEAASLRAES